MVELVCRLLWPELGCIGPVSLYHFISDNFTFIFKRSGSKFNCETYFAICDQVAETLCDQVADFNVDE